MRSVRWLAAAALAAGLVVAALWLLARRGAGPLAPEPRAALVAIEPDGSGVAVAGDVRIEAGRPFTLRAVLRAEDWRGRPVYYTEARRLVVDGFEVPAGSLGPWSGGLEARPLWFTVEGFTPYLEIAEPERLDAFEFREQFRPDWPRGWSVPGSVTPSYAAASAPGAEMAPFGTQRFHVRIELFGPESPVVPRRRFRSPGAESLPAAADRVPAAVVALAGPLERASGWYGLTQIEPTGPGAARIRERLVEWTSRRLVLSRAAVLLDHLRQHGLEWDDLTWQGVETDGSAAWTGQGDLLRAGGRVVLTYRDGGLAGRLDDEDRVLDFDRGARIRALGEVFVGDGLVERAGIGSRKGE